MSQFCAPHGRSVAIIFAKLWYNQFNIITIRAHKFSKNLNYETIKLLWNRSLCLCCLYYFWPPPSSRCQQVSKKLSIRVDCSIWWGIFWHLHKNLLASCSTWKFCDSYCSTAHKVFDPKFITALQPTIILRILFIYMSWIYEILWLCIHMNGIWDILWAEEWYRNATGFYKMNIKNGRG